MIGEDIIENNDDDNDDDEEDKSEENETRGDNDEVVEGEKMQKTANILQNETRTSPSKDHHTDDNRNQDEEADVEDNESDDEPAVEIGIEECEMLKDCLQRKLNFLVSTQER